MAASVSVWLPARSGCACRRGHPCLTGASGMPPQRSGARAPLLAPTSGPGSSHTTFCYTRAWRIHWPGSPAKRPQCCTLGSTAAGAAALLRSPRPPLVGRGSLGVPQLSHAARQLIDAGIHLRGSTGAMEGASWMIGWQASWLHSNFCQHDCKQAVGTAVRNLPSLQLPTAPLQTAAALHPPASVPGAGCSGCALPCPAGWRCHPRTRLRGGGGGRRHGSRLGKRGGRQTWPADGQAILSRDRRHS